jgi:putative membrane protein
MWDGSIILVWIFNFLITAVFWGGIIALIIWGVTKLIKTGKSAGSSALDIAKERYARGEINKEEFEQIKKDIE